MTRAWDSHTSSKAGAKKHTSPKALGPSRTVAMDVEGSVQPYSGLDLMQPVTQASTGGSALTDYACDSGGCSSDPSGTTSVEHGYVEWWQIEDDDSISTSTHYMTPQKNWYTWTAPSPPGSCWGTLVPLYDQNFGTTPVVPLDTADRPLYWSAVGVYPTAANRNTGAPSCASGWGGTGTPPTDIVWATTDGGRVSHYHVWKRADASSSWAEVAAPWVSPSGYDQFKIQQTRARMYGRKNSTTVSYWPVETDFSAGVTDITIPASTIYSYRIWGDWLALVASSGDVYMYFQNSLVGTLGSPHNAATWDWLEMQFGWIVVTYNGEGVQFWRIMDDGTYEHRQTLAGSYTTVGCVGDDHAVSGTWTRLYYDHSDLTWKDGGNMPHIEKLYDDGYRWNGVMHRHIWMNNVSLSPKGYMAQVF